MLLLGGRSGPPNVQARLWNGIRFKDAVRKLRRYDVINVRILRAGLPQGGWSLSCLFLTLDVALTVR